jgi:uncharacterized protein (TIGR00255 family)
MSAELLSMTGFGRATHQVDGLSIEVEIRSVNHRFLDLNVKLPRVYSGYEAELRRSVASEVKRGRVEIFVTRRASDVGGLTVLFNRPLFDRLNDVYVEVLALSTKSINSDVAQNILSRREVLDVVEESSAIGREYPELMTALRLALKDFRSMRVNEGSYLKNDMEQRLVKLLDLHAKISQASALSPQIFKERIIERVRRLGPELILDPDRLAAEVALSTERVDTSEELVRLGSHFTQFRDILAQASEVGRKLDFLLQEIGRELNTITSKAQDSIVQHLVIEAKAEVEKIKEQIQNVE